MSCALFLFCPPKLTILFSANYEDLITKYCIVLLCTLIQIGILIRKVFEDVLISIFIVWFLNTCPVCLQPSKDQIRQLTKIESLIPKHSLIFPPKPAHIALQIGFYIIYCFSQISWNNMQKFLQSARTIYLKILEN